MTRERQPRKITQKKKGGGNCKERRKKKGKRTKLKNVIIKLKAKAVAEIGPRYTQGKETDRERKP